MSGPRLQSVLTPSELALVDQMAEITDAQRTELAMLEGRGNRLGADELGLLAQQLAAAADAREAARLKVRIARGFYGI